MYAIQTTADFQVTPKADLPLVLLVVCRLRTTQCVVSRFAPGGNRNVLVQSARLNRQKVLFIDRREYTKVIIQ